jgi:hypothetical protein
MKWNNPAYSGAAIASAGAAAGGRERKFLLRTRGHPDQHARRNQRPMPAAFRRRFHIPQRQPQRAQPQHHSVKRREGVRLNQIARGFENAPDHDAAHRQRRLARRQQPPRNAVRQRGDHRRAHHAARVQHIEVRAEDSIQQRVEIRRKRRIEVMNVAIKRFTFEQSQRQFHLAPAVGNRRGPSPPRNREHREECQRNGEPGMTEGDGLQGRGNEFHSPLIVPQSG